jgi:WD40 repeat protein
LKLGEGVGALAFSPDGHSIATGYYYNPNENNPSGHRIGTVTLWDVATRKEVGRLEGQDGSVHALTFTRDGNTLALAVGETVRVWNLKTRKQVHRFEALSYELAFSPDGKILAAAAGNHVLLWDTATGAEPAWQTGHHTTIGPMAFSADGRTLASMPWHGGIIRTWDVATGRQLRRFSGPCRDTQHFSFIGNQTLLTVDGNTVQLWDIASGRERHRFNGGKDDHDPGCCLAVAPDGNLIAVADEKTVRLYSPQTGNEQRRLGDAVTVVKGMTFSPDGRLLAVVHAGKRVDIWDVVTGDLLHQLKGHGGLPHWLGYARGGATLISLTEKDGLSVHLWDGASRKEYGQFKIAEPTPTELQGVSPDGRFLAVTDNNGSRLDLWDVALSRKLAAIQGRRDVAPLGTGISLWFHPHAFAPDGRTLVHVKPEGVMQLWEVGTGEEIRRWSTLGLTGEGVKDAGEEVRRPAKFFVWAPVFSPDGRSIAVDDDDLILLWDVTGRAKPGGLPRIDLKPDERDRLWDELNQPHAAKAHRALWALVAAGDPVVPFVLAKLRPRDAAARHIEKLVADLDSVEYELRQAATKELEQIGLAAEPAMRAALKNQPGLEMLRRIQGLLEKLELTGRVRVPRAVCVLEQVGTPAARRALEELAKGELDSRLTQEARSSLGRMVQRP